MSRSPKILSLGVFRTKKSTSSAPVGGRDTSGDILRGVDSDGVGGVIGIGVRGGGNHGIEGEGVGEGGGEGGAEVARGVVD